MTVKSLVLYEIHKQLCLYDIFVKKIELYIILVRVCQRKC